MFTPKAFKEDSFTSIKAFIKEQPQATLIAHTKSGLEIGGLSYSDVLAE